MLFFRHDQMLICLSQFGNRNQDSSYFHSRFEYQRTLESIF